MRNSKFFLGILIGISLVNCNKENIQTSGILPKHSAARLVDVLANPSDPDDEVMNDQLYKLLVGFKAIASNSSMRNIIYNKVAASELQQIKYQDLIDTLSEFKTTINSTIRPLFFPSEASGFDCYQNIQDSMVYNGVSYYPNISIFNLNDADLNKNPIIAIGANVDDSDNIFGYRVISADSFVRIDVSEDSATFGSIPVIIINNGTDEADPSADPEASMTGPAKEEPGSIDYPTNYYWYQYRIYGYRYESGTGNPSELCYILTMHDNNFPLTGSDGFNSLGEYKAQIASISPSDISNHTSIIPAANHVSLFSSGLSAAHSTTYKYAYITLYEKDWYASAKTVDWCLNNSSTFGIGLSHHCHMKYNNEWYYNEWCDFWLLAAMPAVNYVGGVTGSKMDCLLKRTN